MQFTAEEINKACNIAAEAVLKRSEKYKPARATAIKDEKAWICEKVYKGSVENELTFQLKLQWNYIIGGAVGRVTQYVHVRLACLTGAKGRFLRFEHVHMPQWEEQRCTLCPDGFTERNVLEADTSLHEY